MKKHREAIEAKLATVKIEKDKEAHIVVRTELCVECPTRPCIPACPAGNYEWEESTEQLVFNYEGCLECGTCRFICPLDAIAWSYPRGGFGVRYLWG
jgi:ferredoxin like protein